MKNLLTTLFLLALSSSAFAVVDMRNGNYSERFTDLKQFGVTEDLEITRVYNSRATFDGMFGHGWCTDFETRVEWLPDNTIKLTECGAGEETIYRPAEGEATSQTAQRYLAHGKAFNNIVYVDGQFIRTLSGRIKETFNSEGRRIRREDANGNFTQYDYKSGRLIKASCSDGIHLTFIYSANGKVGTVKSSSAKQARYRYKGADLISVTNENHEIAYYHYDDKHRLDRARWTDGKTFLLKYDPVHDWVIGIKDRNKCIERYEYFSESDDTGRHTKGITYKICEDQEPVTVKAEYEYRSQNGGELILTSMRSELDETTRTVRFHELFHLPVSIEQSNGEQILFDYYPNGLLKTRSDGRETKHFSYEQDSVKRVDIVNKDFEGKEVSTSWLEFGYDEKGNMVTANNSGGQALNLSYNAAGQIATLRDNQGHDLSIRYENQCAKPSHVSLKGVGAISITYRKKDCEIKKVTSKSITQVSMQVASTFNNLLDVISPTTAAIYTTHSALFEMTEGHAVECQDCLIPQMSPVPQ